MKTTDWSRTGLGPVADWPMPLKTTVGIALASKFPMLIWWGPDLIHLYNDGYRALLGDKHPAALGAPARDMWAEIWHIVGPMAEGVLAGGPSVLGEHVFLPMNRRGFIEQTYFTFSYSPVRDTSGGVGGVLVTVQETTEQVQGNRQLHTLRDLAANTSDRKTADDAAGATLHLVALSGYGGRDAEAKAQAAGFDLHLTKPVEISVLLQVISQSTRAL